MNKQLCYKCVHNSEGEIKIIDGKEKCIFDCDLSATPIVQDFKKDCKNFKDEKRDDFFDYHLSSYAGLTDNGNTKVYIPFHPIACSDLVKRFNKYVEQEGFKIIRSDIYSEVNKLMYIIEGDVRK